MIEAKIVDQTKKMVEKGAWKKRKTGQVYLLNNSVTLS